MPTPSAYFLVGPTAVGKTAVAHYLAQKHGWAILSADSMLVYRGMDIGTAKPATEMRHEVAYYGVDLVDPGESFNVAQYLIAARAAVQDCAAQSRTVIVVGGTGLYLKILLHGLQAGPPPDLRARARWEALWRTQGLPGLQAELKARDGASFAALDDPNNPRRLIRALEKSATEKQPVRQTWPTPSPETLVGLRMAPEALRARIADRAREMFAGGLVDEVRLLLDQGRLSATAQQAIGYAEAIALLRGEIEREEAIERTAIRTRQLAKRQMTWFRHQLRVDWGEITPAMSITEIAGIVMQRWQKTGPVPLAI